MHVKPLSALLGLSLLFAAAPGSAQDDPVAVVNGEPISQELFQAYAAQRRSQLTELDDQQARQAMKDELVIQELLVQEAREQNLSQDPEVQAQLDLMRRNLLAAITLRRAMAGQQPSEEQVRQEYQSAIAGLDNSEYQARHILVASEDEAQALIDRLQEGADFAELAKEHSTDTSAEAGGELGWFSADMMVPPFAEAVRGLEKGQYTRAPVQTPFGWHVIQLDDLRSSEPPALEQVREQINQRLQSRMLRAYLEGLRDQAEVEVN